VEGQKQKEEQVKADEAQRRQEHLARLAKRAALHPAKPVPVPSMSATIAASPAKLAPATQSKFAHVQSRTSTHRDGGAAPASPAPPKTGSGAPNATEGWAAVAQGGSGSVALGTVRNWLASAHPAYNHAAVRRWKFSNAWVALDRSSVDLMRHIF
jgi:hypothetical protein